MTQIKPISTEWMEGSAALTPKGQDSPYAAFAEELKTKIMEVDQMQHQADESMRTGAVEGATKIHETMIQLEEADISLRLMLKVRDKALNAYQEIMRMQF